MLCRCSITYQLIEQYLSRNIAGVEVMRTQKKNRVLRSFENEAKRKAIRGDKLISYKNEYRKCCFNANG